VKGLTREVLVATGLRVLDQVGLDGLTVRRLATELGVQSPALYWHVRTKQELLDAMAGEIIASADLRPPAPGEPLPEWLAGRARAYRRAMLAHRDGARLVASARRSPETIQRFDAELAAMVDRGFDPVAALRTIGALNHYVDGSVLQEQAAGPDRHRVVTDLPTLLKALEAGPPTDDAAFEHGLRLLIQGIEVELQRVPPRGIG
jgi:TetR/AcrR family transcriptional regulator, tetracycline repressor protein